MKSRSIIFGANGYLGRNLAFYLINQGEKISCYDIQSEAYGMIKSYNQININNAEELNRIDFNVDFIYLFAGLTGTKHSFEEYSSYIDTNEKGLIHLLTCLIKQQSKAKIVFPSTRLIYKGRPGESLKEDAEKEVKTIYAINKMACEGILQAYKNAFDINYTIYRICVPYGHLIEGETSYGTIGYFLKMAQSKQKITLFGDGNLRRTFTHVGDICNKIYQSINKKETDGETYNIGGERCSLLEVAKKIARKYDVDIDFAEWPEFMQKIETGDTVFNSEKLDHLTSVTYDHSIDSWLS